MKVAWKRGTQLWTICEFCEHRTETGCAKTDKFIECFTGNGNLKIHHTLDLCSKFSLTPTLPTALEIIGYLRSPPKIFRAYRLTVVVMR